MKLENLKTANQLAKTISKNTQILEDLSDENVIINITLKNKTVTTIATDKMGESPFSKIANTFISDCIQIQRDEITNLVNQLEDL